MSEAEHIEVASIGGALRQTAAFLTEEILASALSEGDPRYGAASKLIVSCAWKGYWLRMEADPDFEVTQMTANEFVDWLSEMEGRVLTAFESVFPPGQQCEALKSLARQQVWETRKRVKYL